MLSLRADHDDEEDRAEPVYAWEGSLETSWLKVKETEEGKLECDALDQVGERNPGREPNSAEKGGPIRRVELQLAESHARDG